jgi:SAM-dependent methyltransferase
MKVPHRGAAFEHWRKLREGFSPLYSEPLFEVALGHLEPALGPGRIVLDLGCGAGHVAQALEATGARAVALDIHGDVLREGRRRYPGPARLAADQARLPLRSASVDAVFSFSTLQYSDRAAVLAECARVLRPGGRFAIVEGLAGNPFARLGRWLRAASRTPFPPHLEPRGHLRWRDRTIYDRHFREVRFETFHLLTPALLMQGSLYAAPVSAGGERGWRALYAALHRIDRSLLDRWPGARAAAWNVVAFGSR